MSLKTIWPFKKYYMLKEDLKYYKERHSDLTVLLNERNKELNKLKEETKRLWNEKVEILDSMGQLQGEIQRLNEENKRLAESLSMAGQDFEEPKGDPRGQVIEIGEEDDQSDGDQDSISPEGDKGSKSEEQENTEEQTEETNGDK